MGAAHEFSARDAACCAGPSSSAPLCGDVGDRGAAAPRHSSQWEALLSAGAPHISTSRVYHGVSAHLYTLNWYVHAPQGPTLRAARRSARAAARPAAGATASRRRRSNPRCRPRRWRARPRPRRRSPRRRRRTRTRRLLQGRPRAACLWCRCALTPFSALSLCNGQSTLPTKPHGGCMALLCL